MYNKIKSLSFLLAGFFFIAIAGCKKGYFDINDPNPNSPSPSSVPSKYILSGALTNSAALFQGGSQNFAEYYMAYWAVSGDYIPNNNLLTYNVDASFFNGFWTTGYPILANYKSIIDNGSADPKQSYYVAIAKIMSVYHYQTLVDIYNNIPYTEALGGASGNTIPKYDGGKSVYDGLLTDLDAALANISSAPGDAENPGSFDVMFSGDMDMWTKFANTLKLRIVMHQTVSDPSLSSKVASLTADDFLGAGEDATVNPGYSNTASNKQSPLWQSVGFTITGQPTGGNTYQRACTYAVDFYTATNDPRKTQIYSLTDANIVVGRTFGSTNLEHNSDISGVDGPGVLTDASMPSMILPATESLFLQAEAAERGYIAGEPQELYQLAVAESFRLVGVADYENAALAYYSQSNPQTNYAFASDKIKLIIKQKWAALNPFDALESWSDWRRLGIPSDLPASIYPGALSAHVPYRLQYPQNEFDYNAGNVNAQGSVNPLSSKIFWMP